MKMHRVRDAKTIYNSSQNLHYKTKTPARSNINNKRDLRASGLSLLPLALRPGLLMVGERNDAKSITKSNAKSNTKSNIFSNIVFRNFILLAVVFIASLVIQISNTNNVSAASLTLTIPNSISLSISPENGATFKKSSPSILSVKTDVIYGYTLSIKTKDAVNSNNLVNGSAKLTSISSAMSENDFSSSTGNNTWGYLPSKLAGIDNSNFQPGPTSEPTVLDTTDSASEGTDYNFTLGAKVDNTIPTGNYTNTFVLTAVSNKPPVTYMQNWNGCDELGDGDTVELQDIRDKKMYTVAKLKDGKCWMTKNLEIANYNLTSADSDVESEFKLPASSTSGFSSFDVANVYVYSTYGGYYTWYAATAGEGTQSKTSGDTSHSICPKGWKLPTKTEYETLISRQGGSNLSKSPANFQLGASYFGTISPELSLARGEYWTATAYATRFAYLMDLSSSYASVYADDTLNQKNNGLSVRCVAREPKQYSITYDPGFKTCMYGEMDPSNINNMPSPNPQTGTIANDSINLSSSTPTNKLDYDFVQWCSVKPPLSEAHSCPSPGKTYSPGDPFPLTDSTNNITLYAIWKYTGNGMCEGAVVH